jgi:hypothetical protein
MTRTNLPPGLRKAVLAAHDYECVYCENKAVEVDHIVPVTIVGKENEPLNLVPACRKHNNWKSDKLLINRDFYLAIAADKEKAVYANWERRGQFKGKRFKIRATKNWWKCDIERLVKYYRKHGKKEIDSIVTLMYPKSKNAVIAKLADLKIWELG